MPYSVSTPNIRRSTHPSYAPPRPVSWEAHPRVEHGKITEVDAIRGYVEALHDALRGAGDDRLDPLQFLQRHAVVGDGIVAEHPASALEAAVDSRGHEQRGGDVVWGASGPGGRVPYIQQTGFVVGGVGRVRQPAVVEPPRAGERRRGRAAKPDRRPADAEGPGCGRDAVEFNDLPVKGGSAVPQLPPQCDGLVQAGATALPGHLGQRVKRLSEAPRD